MCYASITIDRSILSDDHIACLHPHFVTVRAIVNMQVWVPLCTFIKISLEYTPRSRIAKLKEVYI